MSETKRTRSLREDGMRVLDTGRVTVPKHIRREFELDEDDPIQAVLINEDGRHHFSARVDKEGRVTIPARLRNEYSIETKDDVDIEFQEP